MQAVLYPCVHDFDPAWDEKDGPQCDGAAHVKVVCERVRVPDTFTRDWARALRKLEAGSTLSEAALRAFDSLGLTSDEETSDDFI